MKFIIKSSLFFLRNVYVIWVLLRFSSLANSKVYTTSEIKYSNLIQISPVPSSLSISAHSKQIHAFFTFTLLMVMPCFLFGIGDVYSNSSYHHKTNQPTPTHQTDSIIKTIRDSWRSTHKQDIEHFFFINLISRFYDFHVFW